MAKKEIIIYVFKLMIEVAVLILLSLLIINLIKSDNGLIDNGEKYSAKEKVQEAVRIFSSTEGMTIEEALRQIEGLENIVVDKEAGEYEVIVDGQHFFVTSKELVTEENKDIEKTNEVIDNDKAN